MVHATTRVQKQVENTKNSRGVLLCHLNLWDRKAQLANSKYASLVKNTACADNALTFFCLVGTNLASGMS